MLMCVIVSSEKQRPEMQYALYSHHRQAVSTEHHYFSVRRRILVFGKILRRPIVSHSFFAGISFSVVRPIY